MRTLEFLATAGIVACSAVGIRCGVRVFEEVLRSVARYDPCR